MLQIITDTIPVVAVACFRSGMRVSKFVEGIYVCCYMEMEIGVIFLYFVGTDLAKHYSFVVVYIFVLGRAIWISISVLISGVY